MNVFSDGGTTGWHNFPQYTTIHFNDDRNLIYLFDISPSLQSSEAIILIKWIKFCHIFKKVD